MKVLPTLLMSAILVACATSLPQYRQAQSENSYGYSDQQLSDTRFRVNFMGNSQTTENEVKDMALLRAAELTLLNGEDWFRVVTQDSERTIERSPRASHLSTPARAYTTCGLLGCTTRVSPSYDRIAVSSVRETNVYATSIEIVLGSGEVADATSVYDAQQLRNFLSEEY